MTVRSKRDIKHGTSYFLWCALLVLLLLICAYGFDARPGSKFDISWCDNEMNRFSYAIDDTVCTSFFSTSVGYQPTSSMSQDSYLGYFSPELNATSSTFWPGINDCTIGDGSTLNFNAMGGKPDGTWLETTKFAARLCMRIEKVRDTKYFGWEADKNCVNALPDKADFLANPPRGRFGADFPGQQALCLYASTLGSGLSCDQIAPAGSSIPGGGYKALYSRLMTRVKCVKIPPAPPPPPFCEIIMSSELVRAAYVKPSGNLVNSFFQPAVNILTSKTLKTCSDGTVVDPVIPCADGREGTTNTTHDSQIVLATLTPDLPLPRNQHSQILLGGTEYHVFLTVEQQRLCAKGSFSETGSKTDLGCFPRTMPIKPTLEIFGSIGVSASADTIGLAVYFDNDPYGATAQVPPTSAQSFADMLNSRDTDAFDRSVRNIFGIQVSAARIDFARTEDIPASFTPKKLCQRYDGLYAPYNAGASCDTLVGIVTVPAFLCSDGGIVESAGSCSGASTPINAKKCGPDSFVPSGSKCPANMDYMFYDDDSDGAQICMQGMIYEEEEFFVIRGGAKVKFKQNRRALMPVTVVGASVVFDYSRAPVEISVPTQAEYNDMIYHVAGYFTMSIGGVNGNYIFARKSLPVTINGVQDATEYSDASGMPFYLTSSDLDAKMPTDPITRGLCKSIENSNMSQYRPFDVLYTSPAMYSSHHLADATVTQNTSPHWNKHFATGVPGTMDYHNITYYPLSSMQDGQYFIFCPNTAGCGWSGHPSTSKYYDPFVLLPGLFDFRTDGTGASYPLLFMPITAKTHYFYDSQIDPSGCRSLTFEIWGSGANSRHTDIGVCKVYSTQSFRGNENAWTCDIGHSGETGGYVKGTIKLRRGSKLFVLVASDSSSTPSALWLYDDTDNNPYKLIASAKSGNPSVPESGISLPLSETFIARGSKYRGILNASMYGTTDYGFVDSSGFSDGTFAGLYERPGYFIDSSAILLEYRNITASTYCGVASAWNGNDWYNISTRTTLFGPITVVNSGVEKITPIANSLSANTSSTDIRRIGSWVFIRRIAQVRGSRPWENDACTEAFNITEANKQSQDCLQFAMHSLCFTGGNFTGENRIIPTERCPGVGGSYLSNAWWCGYQSWNESPGHTGMIRLKCT